ncbi:glycoside hydrolase family 9 protein [Chitinophaga japonensis]|nr:glycoside hydrolase family 9 protein [Chitinophaga japonensis]
MGKFHFILTCLVTMHSFPAAAQPPVRPIRLNQCGYYPLADKIAVVAGATPSTQFFILDANGQDTVYTGQLGAPVTSANSSLSTRKIDFSDLQRTGHYIIAVPGLPPSYPFQVRPQTHYAAAAALLKGYYYQRVSMPLEATYAGRWARPAGHPDTAVLVHPSAATTQRPAGTVISSPGGWYDAGDYNKYIVNSGITMGTLLAAYEDFTAYFDTLHTNIPESRNGIPDILDETLYNLRWMLTMQDPYDGGVYNKCTNASFDGMVMPGVTKAPRYVVQKGTAATLDFAAVMAQAGRVYRRFNKELPGLSDSCLQAAIRAWQWAEQHPALAYDQDKMNRQYSPKVTTGGYGDRTFTDEKFWAGAELLASTGRQQYYDAIAPYLSDSLSLPSWAGVHLLGGYTLLRFAKQLPGRHAAALQSLKARFIRLADTYLPHVAGSAFHTVMGKSRRDFIWGSSAVAANQGIVLLNAYLLTKDRKYVDNALTNLDYLLGRNATGYCFVTGIGSYATMHPHHRPSIADGIADPVPGLLAGGPNPGRQDQCHYDHTEPETAYSDTDCSFASNEIAINWNAPAVYLAAGLEALQQRAGYVKD